MKHACEALYPFSALRRLRDHGLEVLVPESEEDMAAIFGFIMHELGHNVHIPVMQLCRHHIVPLHHYRTTTLLHRPQVFKDSTRAFFASQVP